MSIIDSIRRLFGGKAKSPAAPHDERLEEMAAAQRAQDERIDAKISAQERDRRM